MRFKGRNFKNNQFNIKFKTKPNIFTNALSALVFPRNVSFPIGFSMTEGHNLLMFYFLCIHI